MSNESFSSKVIADFAASVAAHTLPDRIHICDGSAEEAKMLEALMVEQGSLIPLNQSALPGSFLHRSDPNDVARTEHLTFICTKAEVDAGPNNNWMSPEQAKAKVWPLFAGAMRGRTLYVVPYLMGPEGSEYARVGVEVTDSPYVVLNLRSMTRMGNVAVAHLNGRTDFVKGIHSLGDLSPDRRFIMHFPEELTIWSVGSGYGGNALLSKKCHALRIASVQARDEGWLAEHMLIAGITNPEGKTIYVAGAFPSACGKTNLAMLVPSLPGWKIDTVGDDIAWLHIGDDGRLWAVNPEAGMFGVAPGTGMKTNPNAMLALEHDVIFTNVALRKNGTPWWEGKEPLADAEELTDWRGKAWKKQEGAGTAAHPNARFTVALEQCPSASGSFRDPRGVPISAFLFGGRRAKVAPLVYEAFDFEHGVYLGSTMVSETTAAATGAVGVPRNDPMAMLPFCGYNMADYFQHWLAMGQRLKSPPKIFHVNWFKTNAEGKYLWPGFGENVRVLDWIFRRTEGRAPATKTAIGYVPTQDALNVQGMSLSAADIEELLRVDHAAWEAETQRNSAFLDKFGARLPQELRNQHHALLSRVSGT